MAERGSTPVPLVIGIVEDHTALREILVEYVGSLPQVGSCSAAPTAEQALADYERAPPDLTLVDLSLPGMNGIELITELRRRRPGMMCGILSGHKSRRYVGKAFAAGASAYMLKGDPAEIERGLTAMLAGRRYVSQGMED
jgi:DNA-binding NarL/FixJ family response regulator